MQSHRSSVTPTEDPSIVLRVREALAVHSRPARAPRCPRSSSPVWGTTLPCCEQSSWGHKSKGQIHGAGLSPQSPRCPSGRTRREHMSGADTATCPVRGRRARSPRSVGLFLRGDTG